MIETLTYFTSAIVTYVLGLLSKKFQWNETLPIPVQNIIVGIIVFLLSLLIAKATGTEIDMQGLTKQIIVALGGAGTATLGYDATRKEEK